MRIEVRLEEQREREITVILSIYEPKAFAKSKDLYYQQLSVKVVAMNSFIK